VRVVAGGTTFPHCFVLKNHRARLFTVTLSTTLILPCHRETARRFQNVAAMRVVALRATHLAFDDRVMLRQIEFGVCFQMALKTGGWVFAGIEDEFSRAGLDVQTASAVTRFAAGLTSHRSFEMNPSVRARWELFDDVRMAIGARFVADKVRSRNFRSSKNSTRDRGAGINEHHGHRHRQNRSPTQEFFLIHVTPIDQ